MINAARHFTVPTKFFNKIADSKNRNPYTFRDTKYKILKKNTSN